MLSCANRLDSNKVFVGADVAGPEITVEKHWIIHFPIVMSNGLTFTDSGKKNPKGKNKFCVVIKSMNF